MSFSVSSVVGLLSDMGNPRLARPVNVNLFPDFKGSWRMACKASSQLMVDRHCFVGISIWFSGKEASLVMKGSLVSSSSGSSAVVSNSWLTSMISISFFVGVDRFFFFLGHLLEIRVS